VVVAKIFVVFVNKVSNISECIILTPMKVDGDHTLSIKSNRNNSSDQGRGAEQGINKARAA
jgi:hypothetical protein